MAKAKKPTSRSSENPKKPLDRIVREQRAASAAAHKKRTTQSTQKGTGATCNKKSEKNSTAPLADEEQDSENMFPTPPETMRKSNRTIRLTEKMKGVVATSKPKAATKAQKPKTTKKPVLDKMDGNRGNAEIEHLERGDHGAKGNSAPHETLAPHSGGREADLERENDELKRIIRRLVTQASSGNENTVIAKGTGSVGNKGYKLRESMELVHDTDLYKRILRSVRDLCHEARIDFNVPYSKQSMTRLGKLFAAASEREPYLKRFENDWATGQIIRQFINSRRKYERRKEKRARAMADNEEEIGPGSEDEENDDYFDQRKDNIGDGNLAFDKHWMHVVGDIGGDIGGGDREIEHRGIGSEDTDDDETSDESGDESGRPGQ